jgi:hypothetical protein
MTQAFNLSQFANTVNSSGQASNSGLQNPSLTVTAGTGMSGGGSVALGSSVTLTNAGVTALTAGTGISVSSSTGSITIANTYTPTGVDTVSGGNGITASGTTAVTLASACPTANSVGSYLLCYATTAVTQGTNYTSLYQASMQVQYQGITDSEVLAPKQGAALSGTWKWMSGTTIAGAWIGLGCRVS